MLRSSGGPGPSIAGGERPPRKGDTHGLTALVSLPTDLSPCPPSLLEASEPEERGTPLTASHGLVRQFASLKVFSLVPPMGKPVPPGRRRHRSQAERASKKLRKDSQEGPGVRQGGAGNSLRAQSLDPLLVAQGDDWKPTTPPRSVQGAAPWTWDVPQGVGPPQAKFVTSSLSSRAGSVSEAE